MSDNRERTLSATSTRRRSPRATSTRFSPAPRCSSTRCSAAATPCRLTPVSTASTARTPTRSARRSRITRSSRHARGRRARPGGRLGPVMPRCSTPRFRSTSSTWVSSIRWIFPRRMTAATKVHVAMTLTAPGCGMGPVIAEDAKSKILLVPGVANAEVRITWEPPWNQSMISEEGKMKLGAHLTTGRDHRSRLYCARKRPALRSTDLEGWSPDQPPRSPLGEGPRTTIATESASRFSNNGAVIRRIPKNGPDHRPGVANTALVSIARRSRPSRCRPVVFSAIAALK